MNSQTNAANTSNEETMDDLGLDETLDDLADLPETKPFPAGAHRALVKIRKNTKKPGQYIVELIFAENIELTNPEDTLPNPGDKSTIFIATKKKDGQPNEFGQGQLKKVMKPIATMLGTNVIADILEATKDGIDCAVVVSIKKDKSGEYDDQQNIINLEVI